MKNGTALVLGLMACLIYAQEEVQKDFIRRKRIVFGKHVTVPHSYPAIAYQALITDGVQPGTSNCWRLLPNFGIPGIETLVKILAEPCLSRLSIKCGGSLVTDSAVQTSCHCLASQMISLKNRMKVVKDFISIWETYSVVHVGIVSLDHMTRETARYTRRYYIHENCQQLSGPVWVNDFGVIILDTRPPNDGKKRELAPMYMLNDLDRLWKMATLNEWACMHLGFGKTVYKNGVYANRARFLFHTWRLIASPNWCAVFTKGLISRELYGTMGKQFRNDMAKEIIELSRGKPEYNEINKTDAFLCSRHLGKWNDIPAYSDSGHAVTCSDMFLSVQGLSTAPTKETMFGVGFSMPLMYNTFVNAAEYRRAFSRWVDIGDFRTIKFGVVISTSNSVPGFVPFSKPQTEKQWSPEHGYHNKREVDPAEVMEIEFPLLEKEVRSKSGTLAIGRFSFFVSILFSFHI